MTPHPAFDTSQLATPPPDHPDPPAPQPPNPPPIFGIYWYPGPLIYTPTTSYITHSGPFTLLGVGDLPSLHLAANVTAFALQLTHGWAPRFNLNVAGGCIDMHKVDAIAGCLRVENVYQMEDGSWTRLEDLINPPGPGNGPGEGPGEGGGGEMGQGHGQDQERLPDVAFFRVR